MFSRVFFYVTAACIAATGGAQEPRNRAADRALDAAALPYDSVFRGYQPYREQNVADWRSVNEEVGRVGGHIGIVGGAGHSGPATTKGPTGSGDAAQPPMRGAPGAPGGSGHAGHH